MDERLKVFKANVRESFAFLKSTSTYQEALVRGMALPESKGTLIPVCELHTTDKAAIALFAKWRRENEQFFTAKFPVTEESTAKWLRERVLGAPERMLFLVLNAQGQPIGHLGWANGLDLPLALEVDNVVRGVKDANPGIMSEAMKVLIKWGREEFSPEKVYLRTPADNSHAIKFYEKLGFKLGEKIPLRKQGSGDNWSMSPLEAGDKAAPDAHFQVMDFALPAWPGTEIILTAGPSVSAREMSYSFDAARHGWNHHWSDYLDKIEKKVAQICGRKYALATSGCTGSLHMSLLACGVGPGDEVIVPDMTWVATGNAAMYCGATPVFVDIDPVNWCMDPESFRRAITPKTKVVMPVFLYGHYPALDKIKAIAKEHNIYVVEDTAPGMGARRGEHMAGSEGHFSCFSFQGAKMTVSGEGGMMLCDDDELYKKARLIWDTGRTPGTFHINILGWKYKMSNLQAAFGLAQVERLDSFVEQKRRIFNWYYQRLKDVPHLSFQRDAEGTRSIYWMTSITLDEKSKVQRDELRARLLEVKVDTRPAFPSVCEFSYWPKRQSPPPVARRIAMNGINLPSGLCLQEEQVDYACRQIKKILGA